MTTPTCTCTEIRINGQIIPGIRPDQTHDCAYVRERDALIPLAADIAAQQTGDVTRRTPAWSTAFADAMTRLAYERLGTGAQP